ncbi:hypothetical protein M3699_25420 [Peribacillus simplex]|uniref:hypothetical protein n=1 Tax=Peribacillus simplex TaxID=1478 RepID=UPI0020404C1A|nr:hypothetical protein [Peribacillus simplex]MCM3677067.1 hypothetical protein [Peribacillus simplex]
MRKKSDENSVQNTGKIEEENTQEPKKYFMDMSYFWDHVGSDSIIDITPNLLNTDSVTNNKIDSNLHELQEKDENNKLDSLLEQIEKIGKEINKIKGQLAKITENNQKKKK